MAAILVIEDDEFFQNFLELVLSGEGHEIRIAADGISVWNRPVLPRRI